MRLSHRSPLIASTRRILVMMVMLAALLPLAPAAQAATFIVPCGDISGLIAAIATANANNQADTIELAAGCVYEVSVPDNGANAFPIIGVDNVEANTLTINGNGATIERAADAEDDIRFFQLVGEEPDDATLILNDLTLQNGFIGEGSGGAIAATGSTLVLNNATLTNNSATEGGAVLTIFSSVTIADSTFSNNTAREGGALSLTYSSLEVENSSFSGNSATGSDFRGGGAIYALDISGSITSSTLTGNTTASEGGALSLYADGGGEFELINSTISGNSAAGRGGGISTSLAVALSFSTITANTADSDNDGEGDGGGINDWGFFGSAVVANSTIIAGNFDTPNNAGANSSFPDIEQGPFSGGYNLIGNLGASGFEGNTTGDRYGDPNGTTTPDPGAFESATPINPALGPLANNGGPTQTHALLIGSVAINNGDNKACPETDQRGTIRPNGPACDIGAYEGAVAAPMLEVVDDTNAPIPDGTTTPLNFGTVAPGATATRSFTIRNIGEVSFSATNFSVTGGFTSNWPATTVIFMPETSLEVQLQFSTSVPGTYNGIVTFETDDPAHPQYTFPLIVVVAGPDIAVSDDTDAPIPNGGPTPVDFGSIPGGGSVRRTFTIRNQGGAGLTVGNMVLPAGFSLVGPFPATTIAAGASLTFEVEFSAAEPGTYTGTIEFDTNDPDIPRFVFPVSGTVTAGPPTTFRAFLPVVVYDARPDLTITSLTLSPGKQNYVAGEPVVVTVVVKNNGTAPTTPFWVDLYLNPSRAPQINDLWHNICGITPCVGETWGVSRPLAPGESITLTTTANYDSARSYWLGWLPSGTTTLYAQADSWNTTGTTGAVNESNETNNIAELRDLTVTGDNPAYGPWLPSKVGSEQSVLPARPVR